MKLPFFWLALGFGAGIVIEPAVSIPSVWMAVGILASLPFLWRARGGRFFIPCFVFLLSSLGILYARLEKFRPPHAIEYWAEESERVSLEGIVKTQPEIQKKGKRVIVSFVLSSRNLMQRREFFQTSGDIQVFLFQPAAVPDFGDRIRLFGTLEKPQAPLNPGQFDYGRYLAGQDIYALFKTYGGRSLKILQKGQAPYFLRALFQVRKKLRERIETLFHGDRAILFKALILGERKGLSSELRDEFIKTGTAHLLAISGLNITLVAGSCYLAMIAAGLPQKISALFALWICMLYVVIAGMGIPVQRAGWMAGAGFLALLFEREQHILNFLFMACWFLLVFDPGGLRNVSFQLSFLSVLSLILLFRQFGSGRWQEFFGASLAAIVGTFPLIIYYFNIFSPVGLLANLGAVPLFHLALLWALPSLAAGGVPFLGTACVQTAGFFLGAGLGWIHLWSKCRWGYFFLTSPTVPQMIFYYAALAIFLGLRRISFRISRWLAAAGLGLWMAAASSFFWARPAAGVELTWLAAGRNELIHGQSGLGGHWLVNTGRRFPSDQGEWIVSPYLRSKGINRLAAILMTDFYKRHTGGIFTLLRNFPIRYLFYPDAFHPSRGAFEKSLPRETRRVSLAAGDRIRLEGGGEILILGIVQDKLIYQINIKNWQLLFLPAFNQSIFEVLRRDPKRLFATDVLFLPSLEMPHGINFLSFFEAFFDQTDPTVVMIPHGAPALEKFLKDRDITLLNLETTGALTLRWTTKDTPETGRPLVEVISFVNGRVGELR